LPKIEEDGGSWLRGPKLYKRIVEPHRKKKKSRRIRFVGHVTHISLCELMNARKNLMENRKGSDYLGSDTYAYVGGDNIKKGLEKLCRCVALIQLVDDGDFVNMSMQLGFHKSWEYLTIK